MLRREEQKKPTLKQRILPWAWTLLASVSSVAWQAEAIAETEAQTPVVAWDLTDIYADDAAWDNALAELKASIATLPELKGSLGKNAKSLATAMETINEANKTLARIYSYANLILDTDQRDSASQERMAKVRAVITDYSEATAWVEPEVITVGGKKINKFIAKEPRLAPYDFYLTTIIEDSAHLLDEAGEGLLASAGAVLSAPNDIYELLVNADVPWPEVTLSTGEKILLNQAGYARARSYPNRADRKLVFDTFWKVWDDYKDSIGMILNTEVQANVFMAKARKYDSVLQQQLEQEHLPEAVYRTLVAEVNSSLPTLHRYFKLRGKILGIDDLRYYDIYPPLVQLDEKFDLAATKKITLEVLKPLGEEYYADLQTAVNGNWAHVYPQPGKRSGAYMNGSVYDVHPYVLLNHNNDYDSLSTFAHEFGHAVHSMLANEAQPFAKADYSTFTAEIASIINEILLEEYLIERAETKEEKLFYLGQALESVRGTYFRQTMFAEFELSIHEAVEAGEPLTGAKLSQMYGELLRKYHGEAQGVLTIDDVYTNEWAYIPHFYYDFYVFQYATSMAGASWFAEQLLAGDTQVRDAFVEVLKAGGSDHAYNILKKAGLDMTQPEPYQATARRMNDIMDRIEALL
ncbi:oligoendopeptidase F [Halioxenophilus sp. WMMB6]|uniref:oligoendopeptidase F n=1 Tax=Halioxenophilus sp. WMMB6 TaxID=3073815 RepID=UPI00295ECE50|nr:oligoendopeptidase F [Halioxenophilus sp. WMMB6]